MLFLLAKMLVQQRTAVVPQIYGITPNRANKS